MVGEDWRSLRAVVVFSLLWILCWFRGYRWALALGGLTRGGWG